MTAISRVLEQAGYETFLPHKDGVEAFVMGAVNHPVTSNTLFRPAHHFVSKAIFALDIYEIFVLCDALVFNMNGRVPDEGGVAEAAMAFTAGKPVVIYKNDRRTVFAGQDNSMVTCLAGSTVQKKTDIPKALIKAEKNSLQKKAFSYSGHPPDHIRKILHFGEKIHLFLRSAGFAKPKTDKEAECILAHLEKLEKETGIFEPDR